MICVYHANCFDGIMAAFVVHKAVSAFPYSRKVNWIAANYGDDSIFEQLSKLEDEEILFVDFSLPREQLEYLYQRNDVFVLDHHKTAQAALEGLPFVLFDLEESGATLAWKYFFPTLDIPPIVQYIRDRDLWKFELPHSKEINAFIQSYPLSIESYGKLYETFEVEPMTDIIMAGEAILRYIDVNVARICDFYWAEEIDGHMVPCVMNNGILHSEIGHELCKRHPEIKFSASIFFDGKKKVYSLRSIGDFDVSEVAKKFGGGGHKNTAGFIIQDMIILHK